ncbi:uncharacterized protein LOC108625871 [Ceratina calcarata]|uniref:Uncharacterized protein LOC108625871 n=1 Tax=Ceratina calcarata TaxID=156304 RepID=A0AAJ7S2G8_9HYME|nr:uncharacterized protein LOC108625871 [Ceratina calcarata]
MMIDLNDEGHDLRLIKNVDRRIELKVLRNELAVRNEILSVKKKELKEKRKELDNINYDIWNTQDRFCDEIWNFSSRHNFNKLFNQYPDGTQIIEPHECKYNSVIDEGAGKTDIQLKLKQEIDIINNELILVRKNNVDVEDDLKRCRVTLDNLVSFSEEALKLIRCIIIKLKSTFIKYLRSY